MKGPIVETHDDRTIGVRRNELRRLAGWQLSPIAAGAGL
jgi:hypothetical protein